MEIILIAGVAKNGVIGNQGKLPWYISSDLKRFKQLTLNSAVIMGRATYESILASIGKPLPDRHNIVLSKKHTGLEGAVVVPNISQALLEVKKAGYSKVFVLGGQAVFEQFIENDLIDKMELTIIDRDYEGDAHFPRLDFSKWKIVSKQEIFEAGVGLSFVSYERKIPRIEKEIIIDEPIKVQELKEAINIAEEDKKNQNKTKEQAILEIKKIVDDFICEKNKKELEDFDPEITSLIKEEENRQENTINLIPSENYASKNVINACANVMINKYAEGYPFKRYYQGNKNVDDAESLAIERAKKLFGAEHVNVQPYSGSPANLAVYIAFLKPGDTVLGLDLTCGGHLTHGSPVNITGINYRIVSYGVDENGYIDMDKVREIALKEKPKLIISGLTAYSRQIDFKRFQEIAEEVGAIHLADISHIAGLIVAGVHPSPFPFTDVVMTTTHKTLRGPRGAILMCKEKYAKQIDKAVFPGCQGGPHENIIAAKAVSFKEALSPEFKEYGNQIIKNAKVLSETLIRNRIKLVSDGTDNHLMMIDLRNIGIGLGKEMAIALEEAGIVCNCNTVPYDPSTPLRPSGLRIGTPMITTRGMKEPEMIIIGEWISMILKNPNDNVLKEKIKKEVENLCKKFPIYKK
jgi:glycine hydroxymethyltransferase